MNAHAQGIADDDSYSLCCSFTHNMKSTTNQNLSTGSQIHKSLLIDPYLRKFTSKFGYSIYLMELGRTY